MDGHGIINDGDGIIMNGHGITMNGDAIIMDWNENKLKGTALSTTGMTLS